MCSYDTAKVNRDFWKIKGHKRKRREKVAKSEIKIGHPFRGNISY